MLEWRGTWADLLFQAKSRGEWGIECHGLVFTVLVPQECLPAGVAVAKRKRFKSKFSVYFLKNVY